MKVVIIGGGIAGLTLGILLRKSNIEININERLQNTPTRGHSFLMHLDGLEILRELGAVYKQPLPGTPVKSFIMKRPEGEEIKHVQLDSWKCIRRHDLLNFLRTLLPESFVVQGRDFSHFIYRRGKAIAAVFLNGEIEYGDLFVGADGANSKVRTRIFDQVKMSAVAVKEIVGVSVNKKLNQANPDTFLKYQQGNRGLAFGMIPTSNDEFVWFMQYDTRYADLADSTPEEMAMFCGNMLKDFPADVKELLRTNDFTSSYIWSTRDFDLLPAFHKENVVLIGDAAHLSLPFTSAGTTNAIIDAKIIADGLLENIDYELAFTAYYEKRAPEISTHIDLGRHLSNQFLNPKLQLLDHIPVPLIVASATGIRSALSKQIEVTYFTDPICSTCWIIQPALRKLQLEYGKYLNFQYVMGGLLPCWEGYSSGPISKPTDAAEHWEQACAVHEMPMDGDVWHEDPLYSSYPPSIAFKAAQMQDPELAVLFLRRIKEMVFLEKRNIIKWEFIQEAAFEAGLDTARLLRDYEGKARDLFRDDLERCKYLGIRSFPTLIFSAKNFPTVMVKGYQPYERYEETILGLLDRGKKKDPINTDPRELFTSFPSMVEKEFALLSNISITEAGVKLNDLHEKGYVRKEQSKNGILWKTRYSELETL